MSKERRIPWDSKEVLGQGELAESILLVDMHGNSLHHHNQTHVFSRRAFAGPREESQAVPELYSAQCCHQYENTGDTQFIEIPYGHFSAQHLEKPMFCG